jgi:hypothetical protein
MGKQDRFGKRNSVARVMNDMGLAAWFGGSLMGAVGLNGAAATTDRPARVSNAGWNRFAVVEVAAMGAYAIGGLIITKDNRARIGFQRGVASTAGAKAGLTGLAMVATAYAAVVGSNVAKREEEGADLAGPSDSGPAPSDEVAAELRRLKLAQWAVPVLTGAIIVTDSQLSEQQRPTQVVSGVLQRLNPAA